MTDGQFIAHLQALHAKGPSALAEMRDLLRNGNLTRLIELAALAVAKKKPAPKAKQETFAGMQFPDWWPAAAWEGYLAMRKKKRIATTDRAVTMLIKEVSALRAAGHDPAACLDHSVLKGWTEIYAPRGNVVPIAAAIENTNLAGWVSRLEIFHIGDDDLPKGGWAPKWGPPPDKPGCLVPAEAQTAFLARHPLKIAAGGK